MEEMYGASRERHVGLAGQLDRQAAAPRCNSSRSSIVARACRGPSSCVHTLACRRKALWGVSLSRHALRQRAQTWHAAPLRVGWAPPWQTSVRAS